MHTMRIRKKSGGYRLIYVPQQERKVLIRDLLGREDYEELFKEIEQNISNYPEKLQNIYHEKPFDHSIIHGFRRGHSPVTNAVTHFGYDYSISFVDIKDCFDNTTLEKVLHSLSLILPNQFYYYSLHIQKNKNIFF